MKRATIAGGAAAAALVLLALGVAQRADEWCAARHPPPRPAKDGAPDAGGSRAFSLPPAVRAPGFLYGRVRSRSGAIYEGRLRWGGDQEAFWDDAFNGAKPPSRWTAWAPKEHHRISLFGIELAGRDQPMKVERFLVTRFGDLVRMEAQGRRLLRVTLKSGTVYDLDRYEASDFDDGLRVWDVRRGVIDLSSRDLVAVDFLPNDLPGEFPTRLHGTARTVAGDFTGFLQWERHAGVGSDELAVRVGDRVERVRFDAVAAIVRVGDVGRATLRDGRTLELAGSRHVGDGSDGLFVADPRYGRVLVPWRALVRLDLTAPGTAGSGPGYGDFAPGRPLAGTVTTRDGRRLAGRLVYDLDESETTESLDAPAKGVDYNLPFDLVAAIDVPAGPAPATVTLRSGEALALERQGDLGEGNAGLLVFAGGEKKPEYVAWKDVARVELAPSPPQ